MAVTIGGVPADIMSIREHVDENGLAATVIYHVPWTDRFDFLNGLAGSTETVLGDPGDPATIVRRVPHAYPDSDKLEVPLYAQPDIDIEPLGAIRVRASDGWADYGKTMDGEDKPGLARITVVYKRTDWAYTGDSVYYSEYLSGSGEVVTVPGEALTANSDSKRAFGDQTLFVPQVAITRIFHRIPFVDETIFSLIGKVNDAPWSSRNLAAGTVLLAQPESRQESLALGGSTYEVTLNFLYRPIPWNYRCRRDTGAFELALNGASDPMYEEGDFSIFEY